MIVKLEFNKLTDAQEFADTVKSTVERINRPGSNYMDCIYQVEHEVDTILVTNPIYLVKSNSYRAVVRGIKEGVTLWRKYFIAETQLEAGQNARKFKERWVLANAEEKDHQTR